MKNYYQVITASLLFLCLTAGIANAGGYQLNLLGQRQIAMGHAGTGLPLDITAIAQNPGGLAALDHNAVMFNSSATFITSTFRSNPELMPLLTTDYETETKSNPRTPFSFFASVDTPVENLRAGLGVYTPYGNGLDWGDEWLYKGLLTEISMTTIFVQPTVSYRVSDRLSIGGGLIYSYGSVNLQRQPDIDLSALGLPDDVPLHVELDGSTNAFGYNMGVQYRHNDMISAGVSYRSEVKMDLEGGDADFTVPSTIPEGVRAQLFPDGNTFDASLPLPAVLSFGLGLNPTDDLRIALDANLTFWSSFESLAFDFEKNTDVIADTDSPRNYNDQWVFRLGGEWDATDALKLRLGGYIDPSPVDDGYLSPETPDVDRIGISTGLGYAITPQLDVNASVLFVTSGAREQNMEHAALPDRPSVVPLGEFESSAVIPGLSLYYKL